MNKYILTTGQAFEACIFDFDGTLVDTEKYHFAAWKEAFNSVNVQFTQEEYLPLRSTGRTNIIKYVEKKHGMQFTEEEKENLCFIKQKMFTSLAQSISKRDLIKGAIPFLQSLRSKGIIMAVATSSAQATEIAKKLFIYDFFSLFLDSANIIRKKPFPDIFLSVANILGVSAENCLVFEDSKVGIEASISAQMSVISVGDLQDTRALMCIPNFCTLLQNK